MLTFEIKELCREETNLESRKCDDKICQILVLLWQQRAHMTHVHREVILTI